MLLRHCKEQCASRIDRAENKRTSSQRLCSLKTSAFAMALAAGTPPQPHRLFLRLLCAAQHSSSARVIEQKYFSSSLCPTPRSRPCLLCCTLELKRPSFINKLRNCCIANRLFATAVALYLAVSGGKSSSTVSATVVSTTVAAVAALYFATPGGRVCVETLYFPLPGSRFARGALHAAL